MPKPAELAHAPRSIARRLVVRASQLSLRATLLLVIPLVGLVVASVMYLLGGRYVSTDNAYVAAQRVLITPEVSGKVSEIAVVEGQLLKPGDVLFSIDPAPYKFAASEAAAKLSRIRSDFSNLKSNLESLDNRIVLAKQSVAANQAEVDRKSQLLSSRVSSASDLDRTRMALIAAKAQMEQLEGEQAAILNQLRGDRQLPIERYPQFVEATAAYDKAARDLANTVLRAPIAGIATQVVSIQMGRYITAGTPVFSVVGTDAVWVDANPKETDLTYVRQGQHVSISVDAFPSRTWRGRIASISPATGAQFAILPPQNASGNWIKIVQRVPVRIEFEPGQDLRRLRSGMSANIDIDTGRKGRIVSLFGDSAVAEDTEP